MTISPAAGFAAAGALVAAGAGEAAGAAAGAAGAAVVAGAAGADGFCAVACGGGVVGAQAAAKATPPARPAYLRNVRRAMRLAPSGAWVEAVCSRSDISPSLLRRPGSGTRHLAPGDRGRRRLGGPQ